MKIFAKNFFLYLLFLFVLVMQAVPPALFAQSTADSIGAGRTWLLDARYGFGTWVFDAPPDPLQTEFTADDYRKTYVRDTLQAATALRSLNTSTSEYQTTLDWVTLFPLQSTGYLAQKIKILAGVGKDSSQALSSLIQFQNSDGGFAGAYGYPGSNNLDTALALQALKAANYSDTVLIGQSLNYLTSNQNADGGWGFLPGQESTVSITSTVLKTLSLYNTVFINQSPINKAVAYLLSKQNADGGFGSSPSKVYETALALDALIASGANNIITVVVNGVGYLTTNQLSDGSWSQDPNSTALALRALASARANLVIGTSDISLSKSMPQENETVSISAKVHNTGFDSASNIIVRFYLGDPSAGGVQIGSDQIIPSLSVNSSSSVSITQSFTGTGGKTIFVVADPDNLISETSKLDNKSSTRIWVATGPDLAIFSEDLKPSTYVPASGIPFTLAYTIRNLGESSTDGFDVALYDGNPSANGTLLQTAHISGLNSSESRTGSLGVTLTGNGPHTLYVVADPGNLITEISKTNNTGTVTIQVGGAQGMADLAVTSADITLTPSRPHAGDTINISAKIHNQGTEAANNFIVEIFDGQPEAGGTLIASQVLSLVAGGSQAMSTNWTIPAGIHDVVVVIDRTNQIAEMNESNNRASVRVMTDMVDISISATDLVFTPAHPVNGDSVVLSITVHNTGIKDTGPFNLALYDGDPAAGGALLQTFAISNIAGDGSAAVSYTFTAVPWTYRFYAIADTENVVTELYEDNNLAIRSLKIKAPGEILGPDLVPVKIDLTDTTTDPQTLTISGNAHVTFQNKGDDKITSSFNVLVFEDTDLDGTYTPGLDNVLSTGTNTLPLWPEGAGMVSAPLSGTVKFLHAPLYALVDSSDAIREQDETNNLLNSCKDCEKRPTNPIQPVVKWQRTDVTGIPAITPLIDTNGDGRADDKDIPALVFQAGNGLYAIRGDTGATIWHYRDTANHPLGGLVAVGDFDGNGFPELVLPRDASGTYGTYINGLVKFDHNGNIIWDNAALLSAWNASHGCSGYGYCNGITQDSWPISADLTHNGKPEIMVGSTVVDGADGSIKWAGDQRYDYFKKSTVADLNLDGNLAIINGYQAYNADGTLRWRNTSIPPNFGLNAVARFGDGPYPEIVLESSGNAPSVYLLDHNGNIIWGPVYLRNIDPNHVNTNATFGLPTIADFDGDGESEIGVRGPNHLLTLDKNGKVKQTYSIPGNWLAWSGSSTPPTVFDLNGDGSPEVLIAANGSFRIFDGKSAALLYETSYNYPVFSGGFPFPVIVADVDGDGQTEAITSDYRGIKVYGSGNNDWVGSRKIWTEYDYHVTNVNDDGSIPQYESPSWLLNNTYRTQAAVSPSTNPYLTPNLTASYLRAVQGGAGINLMVRIGNGGAKEAPVGASVSFHDGASPGGTLLGTVYTTRTLQPGEYEDISFSLGSGYAGIPAITSVVDDADVISECREDDNTITLTLSGTSGMPDLTIGAEDIMLPSGPYYEGSFVSVTANIRNAGYYAAGNVSVTLYDGNPAFPNPQSGSGQAGGTQIATQTISSIDAGGSASITFSFDTLGKSGTHVLYVVVDTENAIAETNEGNNSASVSIDVQQPILPNLSVTSNNLAVSSSSLREGEQLIVNATILNRGASVGSIPVRMSVRSAEFGVGSEVRAVTQTIYPILSLGQSSTVQATFDTVGLSGQQTVLVEIDPDNAITESVETDNAASTTVSIQSAGLATSLSIDKTQYSANSDVQIIFTVNNNNAQTWSGTGEVNIEDTAGNRLATAATFTIQDLEPLGLSGWAYRVPATMTAAWDMKDTLAAVTIDFSSALSSLGITSATVDKNSIRMLELDSIGNIIGEKQAQAIFKTDASATITWLADGPTSKSMTRYFAVCFDTSDHGQKQASSNTKLPTTGKLIAFTDDTGRVYITESNGDGTFRTAKLIDDVTTSNADNTRGIVLDDFNGDGFTDIITGSGSNGKIYYYQNRADGTNTFLPKAEVGTIAPGSWVPSVMGMKAADFNNDGKKDFVVSGNNNSLYLFIGNGSGTFTPSTMPAPSGSSYLRAKSSADFNNDGNADIAISNHPNGAIYLLYGNGSGAFTASVQIGTSGTDPYGVVAGDFDEDGKPDLIVSTDGSGLTNIFKGNGDGAFTGPMPVSSITTHSHTAFDAGDFNNDGHLDIVAATFANNAIEFYPGNGDGTFGAKTTITATSGYSLGISASPALVELHPALGAPETIPVQTYQFTWNTGSILPGQYQVHATLSEGAGAAAENKAGFEILADVRAAATVVTDKISYNPNQTATITSTVTSRSANYILENLTAKLTIGLNSLNGSNGSNGSGFTEAKNITTLMPGASFTFKSYWNTGTTAPGTYPVTLELKDQAGTVIATGPQNIVISSNVKPSAVLKGQVSIDKQSLLSGETVTVSYGVTNVGNVDLQEVALSVLTVNVADQTVYNTLSTQATLTMGGSYTNTGRIETTNFSAKDYLVVLRATIAGVEETLAGAYFRVEGEPTAPSLAGPAEGTDVDTFTPALTVNNASDPNDDVITYEFEVYSDSGFMNLVAASGLVSQGTGTTSWQTPFDLNENQTYFWRARAYDGTLYGPWMNTASFRVNTVNDPPSAPVPTSPADSSAVAVLNPALTVTNAFDPDSANLTYNFQIAFDSGFTQIVAFATGIQAGQGTTSWQAPLDLQENSTYYWRAQADDWFITGPWSAASTFFVNTANDAPTVPAIISPANNSTVASLASDIVISNSSDPDSAVITNFFELDTVMTFDSTNVMRSGAVSQGQGTTVWTASGLSDNTRYYVRVKASDGTAESDWSPVVSFFANTANDAPTAPVPANPSNGSAVNVLSPTLSVQNSTDPDRDVLTYQFEVYSDPALTGLVANASGIAEGAPVTSWTVPVTLSENATYYWRARAFDGTVTSEWAETASFMVNTANDTPGAPQVSSPADGSSIATLTPTVSVLNAADPDSDKLIYDFEVYSGGVLVESMTGIPQNNSGITSVTLSTPLSDNAVYQWRARAFDGDRYGPWTAMAAFTVHMPVTGINATINFDPDTLNKGSKGTWVVVYIELPSGYKPADIDISSVRMEGTVPAEAWPYAVEDHDKDGTPDLMVKFKRSDVIAVLPQGDHVPVHVTGKAGTITFEGVDIIRVMP